MGRISREISGAPDFELGLKRTSPVAYHCTLPAGTAKGLIFVIPGFGEDAAAEYNEILRRYLSGRYGLAAVSVAYHASQARPPAARIDLSTESVRQAIGHLAANKIRFNVRPNSVDAFLAELGRLETPIRIAAKLIPPNGDYQNFGVMQALDHICVLNDILDSGIAFDRNNILLLGSSHGAYIAHLIHKFAPNTINAIIDNSGYAIPVAQYLGSRPEYYHAIGNLTLACNIITRWDLTDSYSSTFFGPARYAIRDVSNPGHLAEDASKTRRPCLFRMLNSCCDPISPLEQKQAQLRALQSNGFDAELRIIGEQDLDGKIFKSLGHGLGASLSGLFDLYADSLTARPTIIDRELRTSLSFACYDRTYSIRHSDTKPYLDASCERILA
ncbi:MAG TPA: DUF2920 family protein [Bryobacteraceae bacterium]|nr:DUF2920 family protein [Bryobacteraceae bacterium]